MARLLKQFEGEYLENDDLENLKNMLDDFPHLVTLYSQNCADGSVVAALHTLEDIG